MTPGLSIRLSPDALHCELLMPSGRWLSIPLDRHLPVRLGMILGEHARVAPPKIAQRGNPTAYAIEKAWDLEAERKRLRAEGRLRAVDSQGFEKNLSLEDLGL